MPGSRLYEPKGVLRQRQWAGNRTKLDWAIPGRSLSEPMFIFGKGTKKHLLRTARLRKITIFAEKKLCLDRLCLSKAG